jgi:hypothetical protein
MFYEFHSIIGALQEKVKIEEVAASCRQSGHIILCKTLVPLKPLSPSTFYTSIPSKNPENDSSNIPKITPFHISVLRIYFCLSPCPVSGLITAPMIFRQRMLFSLKDIFCLFKVIFILV